MVLNGQHRAQGKEYSVTFTEETLKQGLKFLQSSCFFKLGNKVFQQVIGIPDSFMT